MYVTYSYITLLYEVSRSQIHALVTISSSFAVQHVNG